jgi:hypothetical protein
MIISDVTATVIADSTTSLNDACKKLDKNFASPTVRVVIATIVNYTVDIAGLTLVSDSDSDSAIVTIASNVSYFTLTAEISMSSKTTLISRLDFIVLLSSINLPILNATSLVRSSSLLNLSQVSISYRVTPSDPLITINGLNNVVLDRISMSKTTVGSLANADDPAICDPYAHAPALDLNGSVVNVSSSSFLNINTGLW